MKVPHKLLISDPMYSFFKGIYFLCFIAAISKTKNSNNLISKSFVMGEDLLNLKSLIIYN